MNKSHTLKIVEQEDGQSDSILTTEPQDKLQVSTSEFFCMKEK